MTGFGHENWESQEKVRNFKKKGNKLNVRDIWRKGSDFRPQGHDFRPCRSKYNARSAVNLTNQRAQCTMYINYFCTEQLLFYDLFLRSFFR